jgi:hypothetical protein
MLYLTSKSVNIHITPAALNILLMDILTIETCLSPTTLFSPRSSLNCSGGYKSTYHEVANPQFSHQSMQVLLHFSQPPALAKSVNKNKSNNLKV